MSAFATFRELQYQAAMRNERLYQFALTEEQGRALAVEIAEMYRPPYDIYTPEDAYAELLAGQVTIWGLPVVIAMTKNIG